VTAIKGAFQTCQNCKYLIRAINRENRDEQGRWVPLCLPAAPFCQTKRRAAFADNDVVENPLPYFPPFFSLCWFAIAKLSTQRLQKTHNS